MKHRTSLAALAAVLTATACTPLSQRTAQDFLAASPAAVSEYQRGKADLGAGNYGLALSRFSEAVRRDPRDVAALNGEAIALAKLDRDEEAATTFERALRVDGGSELTLTNYANFLDRHGDHDKAAILLAQLNPQLPAGIAPPEAPVAEPVPSIAAAAPEPPAASLAVTATPAAPAPAVASQTPSPGFTISNASGQYRLARRLQQYLAGQGYAAEHVANAPRFDRTQSVLYCHAQSRAAAEEIKRALPETVKLVVLVSQANRIELVAGSDLNHFDARLAFAAPLSRRFAR